jgi:hypothetical protein
VLVAILNHERTSAALRLADAFRAVTSTVTIDSGSRLSPEARARIDVALPNVYYAGLLGAAVTCGAHLDADDVLYVVCSDVDVPDPAAAVARCHAACADPAVALYAPAVDGTGHRSLRQAGSGGLRPVCFVEGTCFASRLGLVREMCPVDPALNRLGWGLDVYLGYLALRAGRRAVVDDGLTVVHHQGTGYSVDEARRERDRWFATLGAQARAFRRLSGISLAHTRPGIAVVTRLPWQWTVAPTRPRLPP